MSSFAPHHSESPPEQPFLPAQQPAPEMTEQVPHDDNPTAAQPGSEEQTGTNEVLSELAEVSRALEPISAAPPVLPDKIVTLPVRPSRIRRAGSAVVGLFRKSAVRSEQAASDEIVAANVKLLQESGEHAASLLPAYHAALEEHPEIARVTIRRNPEDDQAYSRPDHEHGNHTVFLPLAPESPKLLAARYTEPTGDATLQVIADHLGTTPDYLLNHPMELYEFVFLHEIGHTVQYIENEGNEAAFQARRRQEWQELPVPDVWTSRLRPALQDENSDIYQWVTEHWEELQRKYGVATHEDLLRAQAFGQRQIFTEQYADRFATEILTSMGKYPATTSF